MGKGSVTTAITVLKKRKKSEHVLLRLIEYRK